MADARTRILKPRFRWRKFFGVVLLLIGVLAALHAAWDWHAERALRMRVEQLQAAGERILPAEFAASSAEYGWRENGALDLVSAAAIVNDYGPESEAILWLPTTMPADAKVWPHLARARQWYEPALRRVERAQSMPYVQFTSSLVSPVAETLDRSPLNGLRDLGDLLSLTALVEHHDGRDDLVVRRLGQLNFIAEMSDYFPSHVGHFVALTIHQTAATRIEQFGPSLSIGSGEGQAAVADVRKLIAALLDESKLQAGQKHALEAERMTTLDSLETMARSDVESTFSRLNPIVRYALSPYIHANALRALEYQTDVTQIGLSTADWPTASARLGGVKPIEDRFLIARGRAYGIGGGLQRHFETLTDRRLAATALAMRLYRHDHAGARPQRLEELVPKYLPAVPLDAMAAGNRRLSYLPDGAHPVLYSVWRNGDDDAASEAPMPGRHGEIYEFERLDRVFYLTARPHEVVKLKYPGQPDEVVPASDEPVNPESIAPWERDGKVVAATTQMADLTPR